MNIKRLTLISLFVLIAFVISSCGTRGPITTNWPGLSADADRAYIATGSFVYAVDLKTNKEVWHYPSAADSKQIYYSNPLLTTDGQLLIGSEGSNRAFVSINPETGKDNWTEPFSGAKGSWVASPLVLNDKIYAPNSDGFIYILDMKGKSAGDPIDVGGTLWSAPATDGTVLYVASLDHKLHVIDPASGKITDSVDLGGAAPSSPVIAKDGAYVGSFASKIEFVNSKGHGEAITDASNWIWGTPTLDNETLYYADLNGSVYSLDLATGKQNWGDVKPDGPVVARLLVVGDQIYVASEAGTLVALDRDAKTVWDKKVGDKGQIYTSPVVSGDLILVAPYLGDFMLAAYDAEGKQAWTFTPAK